VLHAYRRTVRTKPADPAALEKLTEREIDVLREVGRGSTNAEIAAALFVSEATVKSHLSHILTKLDLRDRAAAIVFAHNHGLA
jgi:DNA-binding NarL/FixJ family response regulator